jgi:Ran GTPase-activating protein (RanGAP) involved in mRNA processing and transport
MKMRGHSLAVIGLTSLLLALPGCGKIPTWGELTGQAKPVEPPVIQQVTPVTPTITQAPAAPPEPTPDEIIASFTALQPHQKSDADFQKLTSLKEGTDRIIEINADGSPITKGALTNIDRLTNLKQLRLNHTKMDDEACQKIASLSSLEVLALGDTQVTDVGVAAISALQNLKHLELTNCLLSENGFRAIGSLPELKTIKLEGTNMDNRGLDLICNAKTLTNLVLTRNAINDFGLGSLSKLDSLEALEISTTSINGEGFVKAMKGGGLKNLRELGIYGCMINMRGAKAISTFKSLERLNIGELPHMDDVGLDNIIKGMKNLKYINLSKCSALEGYGLKSLKGSKEMEELYIDQCAKVGDPVIPILKTMKNLKRVTLGGTAVTPRGRAELQSALPDAQIN